MALEGQDWPHTYLAHHELEALLPLLQAIKLLAAHCNAALRRALAQWLCFCRQLAGSTTWSL